MSTRARRWTGRTLSTLAALFLLLDGAIKLVPIDPVTTTFAHLGWPVRLALTVGVVELACVAVYLVPRTATVGAVLLTGFLGGAIATHLRVGDPLFGQVLFPTYVAALLWGGLLLRDERLRALLPGR